MTKINIDKYFNTEEEYNKWLDEELDDYVQGRLVVAIETEKDGHGIRLIRVKVID